MRLAFFRHGATVGVAAAPGAVALSPWRVFPGAPLFHLPEYATHRLVFHARPASPEFARVSRRRTHYDHHLEPSRLDLLFLPPWFLAPNFAATAIAVSLVLGISAVASVMLGVALTIPLYEWTRYVAHIPYQPRTRFGAWMKRYHRRQHFISGKDRVDVGNPSLDVVFGTFRDARTAKKGATARKLPS